MLVRRGHGAASCRQRQSFAAAAADFLEKASERAQS